MFIRTLPQTREHRALGSFRSLFRSAGSLALCLVPLLSFACASAATTNGGAVPADPLDVVQAEQLFQYGRHFAQRGEALRAEEYLTAAIAKGYPEQRVLPVLLKVCLAAQRLGAALHYAQPYLTLHPEDTRLRYLVATVQLAMARPNDARRELERVERDAPDFADAYYLLGVIARDYEHDAKAAAAQFRTHHELAPSGLHGAEVTAWLREHDHAPSTSWSTSSRSSAKPSNLAGRAR